MNRQRVILSVLLLAMALISGCSMPALVAVSSPADPPAAPRVFFVEPTDGATTGAPFRVVMGAERFTVEPAGEIREGAGHLHIMVDTDCVAAGQVVPNDETHLHFGQGQTETELDLAPGEHTLCLQAADGAHIALPGEGMTDRITITVQ